jgi:hypothetical protein
MTIITMVTTQESSQPADHTHTHTHTHTLSPRSPQVRISSRFVKEETVSLQLA